MVGVKGEGIHPISLTGKEAHLVAPRKCCAIWVPGSSVNQHLSSPEILSHSHTQLRPSSLVLRLPHQGCPQGSSRLELHVPGTYVAVPTINGAFPGCGWSWLVMASGLCWKVHSVDPSCFLCQILPSCLSVPASTAAVLLKLEERRVAKKLEWKYCVSDVSQNPSLILYARFNVSTERRTRLYSPSFNHPGHQRRHRLPLLCGRRG